MKSPSFFFDDNYERDELKLAEFFPVPLRTRLKKTAQKSFWPFVVAAVVATAVALTVAVATGGLSIPGTGLIAAYQGLFYPVVKKIVIAGMAAVSFGLTFVASKWFFARREAMQTPDFTHHMRADYEDSHKDLPENLRVSNVKEIYITGYHQENNTVTIANYSTEQPLPEVVHPKEACFVPLATPRLLNSRGDRVTHYREQDDYFRILKADGLEDDLSRQQMFALREPTSIGPTKATLFLSRPSTMKPLDPCLDTEAGNTSIVRISGSPSKNVT